MAYGKACTLAILAVLAMPAAATAQVSIGPNGIRTGDTVVDGSGVHTNGVDVTGGGVRTGHGSGTVIRGNGQHRAIDCGGGGLTVDGNANHLTILNCARVVLNGNGNDLDASFARASAISVMGNRNSVRWHAGPRVHVGISNVGTGNALVRG